MESYECLPGEGIGFLTNFNYNFTSYRPKGL